MSDFIKINKDFTIEQNFWDINPQIALISPFSLLYKEDSGGDMSSRYMWACFFMCDPDDKENRLFRLPVNDRKNDIIENYFNEDNNWSNEIFQQCLEAYSIKCLTSIERALKEEEESLLKRSRLLSESEYTLDYTRDDGKTIKGTAPQLDAMRSKTLKIYQDLEKTIEKFSKAKEDESRVYGGRKETISEKGDL